MCHLVHPIDVRKGEVVQFEVTVLDSQLKFYQVKNSVGSQFLFRLYLCDFFTDYEAQYLRIMLVGIERNSVVSKRCPVSYGNSSLSKQVSKSRIYEKVCGPSQTSK